MWKKTELRFIHNVHDETKHRVRRRSPIISYYGTIYDVDRKRVFLAIEFPDCDFFRLIMNLFGGSYYCFTMKQTIIIFSNHIVIGFCWRGRESFRLEIFLHSSIITLLIPHCRLRREKNSFLLVLHVEMNQFHIPLI